MACSSFSHFSKELLSYNPNAAILKAMAALIVDAEKLHAAIEERNVVLEDYST
jgi:hypothetical protein